MRKSIWLMSIWGAISVFSQTDVFPNREQETEIKHAQMRQAVEHAAEHGDFDAADAIENIGMQYEIKQPATNRNGDQ